MSSLIGDSMGILPKKKNSSSDMLMAYSMFANPPWLILQLMMMIQTEATMMVLFECLKALRTKAQSTGGR